MGNLYFTGHKGMWFYFLKRHNNKDIKEAHFWQKPTTFNITK